MGTKCWNEYRRCERCKTEYRPQRRAQSYCSRDCRRQAAYGRERFKKGTRGPRRKRLEASETLQRKGDFSSSKTGWYRPTNWIDELNQAVANEIDQAYWTREKRNWPIDLMGGQRNRLKSPKLAVDLKVCRTVLNTERLLKDEAPGLPANATDLEFYEDGFPKLPACLDRRPKLPISEAA